jgi:formylglycine-generating enzyme required for sulfatase activity
MFGVWIRGCASVALISVLALVMSASLYSQTETGKRRALLVGVTKYNDARLSELKYTENDATKLAQELKACGFEVTLLTNSLGEKDSAKMPTAANIRKELDKMLKGLGSKDTVLVGLAGHGLSFEVQVKKKNREESFFCPFDARPRAGTTLEKNSETMLGYTELLKKLDQSGCGAKLLLVDACRNAPEAGFRSAPVTTLPRLPIGTAALFSCKTGEKSIEDARYGGGHGLFFHHVIQGLRGKGRDDKGRVTWGRLAAYVTEQVQEDAQAVGAGFQQTPEHRSEMTGALILRTGLAVVKEPMEKSKKVEEKIEKVKKLEELTIYLGEKKVPLKLVKIPAGEFFMGADKDLDDETGRNKVTSMETPRHKVKITKAFWLGVYEVTQSQYEAIMGTNPSWFTAKGGSKEIINKEVEKGDTSNFPVEQVSWDDAKQFCEKLSKQPSEVAAKRVYRLPTEAQWEYACRGRSKCEEKYQKYHFGDKITKANANYGKMLGRTSMVGSYPPNAFGLYDMHGNIWEWCEDGHRIYDTKEQSDPVGPLTNTNRMARGGSWIFAPMACRAAFRPELPPGARKFFNGMRVAMSVSE